MSVKGSEACQILPNITFVRCLSLQVLLCRHFRRSERGIKSLRLEVALY